jgi:hypothetical protein
MEDFELVGRLRARAAAGGGAIVTLPPAAHCDPRRWQAKAVWRTNLVNQAVMLWYRQGGTPQQLFDFYYNKDARQAPGFVRLANYLVQQKQPPAPKSKL